jgi:hypothetical protein
MAILKNDTSYNYFRGNRYDFRRLAGDEDLQAIYRLSSQVYGEAAVDLETRRRWSQLFPDGNLGCFFCDELVGFLSIWPISAADAAGLESGQLHEGMILPLSQDECRQHPAQHWLCLSIIIADLFRGMAASPIKHLIEQALLQVWQQKLLQEPFTLYAQASTPEGLQMMLRSGFSQRRSAEEMPNALPLHAISCTAIEELQHQLLRGASSVTLVS